MGKIAIFFNGRQKYRLINAASLVLAAVVLFFCPVQSQELKFEVVLPKSNFAANDTLLIGLRADIPADHHLYGNPLGPGIGKPFSITVKNTKHIEWIDILKLPARKYNPVAGDWVWAYDKKAYFFLRGTIKPDAVGNVKDTISFSGLICNTACIPANNDIPFSFDIVESSQQTIPFNDNKEFSLAYKNASESASLNIASDEPESSSMSGLGSLIDINLNAGSQDPISLTPQKVIKTEWNYTPIEQRVQFTIWLAILFGFLAGVMLNAMPCVLPVLGIKILSFSQSNHGSRSAAILRSLIFSAGILAVFMILASLASFAKYSWGEQFQNPNILIGIVVLIVVFALWMFDIFMFSVPGAVASMERKSGNGLVGDFFRGVFATILATPCSGPLLGATLAWTLTQSNLVIYVVFASIGVGMAFPYVLLSASKRLSKLIPKPGKWMKDFKNLMGFLLLIFAVYLLLGLPRDMIVGAVGICLTVIFAIALYLRFSPWDASWVKKIIVSIIAVIIAITGIIASYEYLYKSVSEQVASGSDESRLWQEFSSDVLEQAHRDGKDVMIDFTANWCMNCQYNKIAILHSKEVVDLINKKAIVCIKADLTKPDQEIESLMHHLGSRSIPFFALFPADNPMKPVVKRDLLNKKDVVELLKTLK
jgi:thiol:disulfide interchange protein